MAALADWHSREKLLSAVGGHFREDGEAGRVSWRLWEAAGENGSEVRAKQVLGVFGGALLGAEQREGAFLGVGWALVVLKSAVADHTR